MFSLFYMTIDISYNNGALLIPKLLFKQKRNINDKFQCVFLCLGVVAALSISMLARATEDKEFTSMQMKGVEPMIIEVDEYGRTIGFFLSADDEFG
jgi:hypothetical protein